MNDFFSLLANVAVCVTLIILFLQYKTTDKRQKEKDLDVHKQELAHITVESYSEFNTSHIQEFSFGLSNESKYNVTGIYIIYISYIKDSDMRDTQINISYIPFLTKNEKKRVTLTVDRLTTKNEIKTSVLAFCYTDYQGKAWGVIGGEINQILLEKNLVESSFLKPTTLMESKNIFASPLKDLFKLKIIAERGGKIHLDLGIQIWLGWLLSIAKNPNGRLLQQERAKNIVENPNHLNLKEFIPEILIYMKRVGRLDNRFMEYFTSIGVDFDRRFFKDTLRLVSRYVSYWMEYIKEHNPDLYERVHGVRNNYNTMETKKIIKELNSFTKENGFPEEKKLEERISILYLKYYEEMNLSPVEKRESLLSFYNFFGRMNDLIEKEKAIKGRKAKERIDLLHVYLMRKDYPLSMLDIHSMLDFADGKTNIFHLGYSTEFDWLKQGTKGVFWMYELGEQVEAWRKGYWDEIYQKPKLSWKIAFLMKKPYEKFRKTLRDIIYTYRETILYIKNY